MQTLLAANWKMFKTGPEAIAAVQNLVEGLGGVCPVGREVLIFAPFTALEATARAMNALPGGMVGAQNLYPAEEGAFTGEISPRMIAACGATWVLTGHSERRHIMGETNAFVGRKTGFALNRGLRVTLCVGETLEEREAGKLEEVLSAQLREGLADLPETFPPEALAVAYEPVWAIGTGKSARPEDIVDAHGLARTLLKKILGPQVQETRLLYGGSVKPDNAASILALDNVDGVLVGGASLQAESFIKIVTA